MKPSTALESIRLAFTNYQNRIDQSQQQVRHNAEFIQ